MASGDTDRERCLRGASIPVVLVAGIGLVMAIALFSLASRHCAVETAQHPGSMPVGSGWHAWAILVSSLALTGLLTAYFLSSVRYARGMAALAGELARANARLSEECAAHARAVGEIQSLQRQIEFVLGATKTGLDIIDGQSNLRYVDPAWAKHYGDPTGRKCHEYFMGRDEPCPDCGIPTALETKSSVVTEETLVREHNRRIQVTTIPFQDESGEWLAAEVNVDITEQAQRAEELASAREALLSMVKDLERARREAEDANKAKSEFLASMSHELRTPMNAILGFAKLLLREPLTEDQRSCVETICRGGNDLLALINGILDLSKLEARRVQSLPEMVDIASVVVGVCELLEPRAAEKGIRLAMEVNPRVPLAVTTDQAHLRQVLINLVGNAVKFTDAGSVTLTVAPAGPADLPAAEGRQAGGGDEGLHFAVADTGIGIPRDRQEAVFEAFVQGDGSISRRYGGTGLGLAISKRLVELLGGRIWVESTPGKGSTFHFTIKTHLGKDAPQLPIGDCRLPIGEAAEVRSAECGTRNEIRNQESEIRNGEFVLIVEDDPTTARLTSANLRKAGYACTVAQDGAEAIQAARRAAAGGSAPLAVVLDLVLPVMDGFQVLQGLKADPALANIPVIVCSVLPERRKAFSLGALDYIEKPIDGSLLVRKLDRLRCAFGTGGNVLVVDDDPTTRLALQRVLARAGYRVATAASGNECLAMVDARQPADLVVLDLVMPGMDGFETLAALRQCEATRNVPVIVNTARDLSPDDMARLNGRYDTLLNKSAAALPDIVARVAELLDAARRAADPAGAGIADCRLPIADLGTKPGIGNRESGMESLRA